MTGVSFMVLLAAKPPSGTAVTSAFTATAANATSLTTYSFASVAIGADVDRKVVAVFTSRSGTASGTLSSCTIAGISATCTTLTFSNNSAVAIAVATVPAGTGTTGTIAPTWSVGMARCAVAVYTMQGASSNTPTATGLDLTNAYSYSLTCTAGSCVFGAVTDADTTTCTWTNLTEDVDAQYGAQVYTMASANFAGAQSGLALTGTLATSVSGAGGFAVFSP